MRIAKRTLAIDCATEACSVALFVEGEPGPLAYSHEILGRGHAERLVPMIADLPARGRADRICVSLGPGSFTGVRIGLATARALGIAWDARVEGFSTLALIAAMARREAGAQPVGVAMAGGHGEWFVQAFDRAGAPAEPLRSSTPDAAAAAIAAPLVAGSRAEALIELRGTGRVLSFLPDARAFPALPDAALSADLSPLYGRAPDAKPQAARR